MKLVASLALAIALSAGCSVSHRSNDFACSAEQLCSDGRVCVDGFCVVPGGPVDARPGSVCPAACTSCDFSQNSCTIDCALTNDCKTAVACPTGMTCTVLCSTLGSCTLGVICGGATSCTVACTGRQSCRGVTGGFGRLNLMCSGLGSCSDDISCGPGPCTLTCSGTNTCNGALSCGTSCACGVTCQSTSCANLDCRPGCDASPPMLGCVATGSTCNACR